MSRVNQPPYDDSDVAASRPLRLDEVEALILDGGRLFHKDRGRVVHLLERMAATIRDHRRRFTELHDDVDRIRAERAESGHPMARASAALAELDLEQQGKLLDGSYIAALEKLEGERSEVEKLRLLAVNDVNRVRLLVAQLSAEPSLSPLAREKLEQLLAQLPPVRNI